MASISAEDLRASTLRRQFPDLAGRGSPDVVQLFTRLGPIQSQVPRAPFLAASSRLPGVPYATVVDLFDAHRLVKASTLRGTVHTAVPDQFGWTDTVARSARSPQITRSLKLTGTTADQLTSEIEAYAGYGWTPRSEIVAHVRGWLAGREPSPLAGADPATDALIWGHSGLLRRPKDTRWETRTDTLHRTARAVLPQLAPTPFPHALAALVRVHLGAYGPATRDDLAFFCGVRLREVDAAVVGLGEEIVRLRGPDGTSLMDLAEPPTGGRDDPGVRLLGEFDGLLLGYQARGRTRFLDADQLAGVWAKANGLFSPVVLAGGRIVATWRTITRGQRADLEVVMLPGCPALEAGVFDEAAAATAQALGRPLTDVRVLG